MVKDPESEMVKHKGEGSEQMIAVNRGAWTDEEDKKLVDYVRVHGDRNWRLLPIKAGLNRCGKSCRLRWLNYLRPGIKRGNISEDEEDLIIRLHNLLGNRWSLIAGRLPGRTDNEIKNHWNTHLSKKALTMKDLNSKLHKRLESGSSSSSSSSSVPRTPMTPPLRAAVCPVPIVEPPKGSPSLSNAGSQAEEICRQVPDANEMPDLPVVLPPVYNGTRVQCPYQSLSGVLLQPLPCEEGLSFEQLAGLIDYKDYLLHLL